MTQKEGEIEQSLITRLTELKYTYRPDIRDQDTLERNFREKFEALNWVKLTDSEFARLRDEIVNADVLKALGPRGVLINVARGSVVDEPALVAALKSGTILAAGLDVFTNEPSVPDELKAMQNVVLLPHIGSASVVTRNAMDQLVVDNLKNWFAGKPPLTPVAETPVKVR